MSLHIGDIPLKKRKEKDERKVKKAYAGGRVGGSTWHQKKWRKEKKKKARKQVKVHLATSTFDEITSVPFASQIPVYYFPSRDRNSQPLYYYVNPALFFSVEVLTQLDCCNNNTS